MQLEPGQVIDGRFEVEAMVGEGGLAEVYRVRHRELGRVMALKLLIWRKKSLVERLVLEGRIQAQLNHPNVVAVLDLVRHEGQVGLLMEYIDAETLAEHIDRAGATPEDEALELLAPILAAVDSAHNAGITHRDLKPANIMLANVGTSIVPKVADFGIAKVVQDASAEGGNHTQSGATMGTPGYLAPEQVYDASTIDARADVFALGAIAYELLCGQQAFADECGLVSVTATATLEPQHLQERCRVTECVAKAIHMALTKDLDERYPSVDAFAEALLRNRVDLLDRFRGNSTGRVNLSIPPTEETGPVPRAAVHRPPPDPFPIPTRTVPPTAASFTFVAMLVAATVLLISVVLVGGAGMLWISQNSGGDAVASVAPEAPAQPAPTPQVEAAVAPPATNEGARNEDGTLHLGGTQSAPAGPEPVPAVASPKAPPPRPVKTKSKPPPTSIIVVPVPVRPSIIESEDPEDAVAVVAPPPDAVAPVSNLPPPPKPVAPNLTGEWSGKAGRQPMILKLTSDGSVLSGTMLLYVGSQVRSESLRGTVAPTGAVRFSAGDLSFSGIGSTSSLTGTYMRDGAKKSLTWAASK